MSLVPIHHICVAPQLLLYDRLLGHEKANVAGLESSLQSNGALAQHQTILLVLLEFCLFVVVFK